MPSSSLKASQSSLDFSSVLNFAFLAPIFPSRLLTPLGRFTLVEIRQISLRKPVSPLCHSRLLFLFVSAKEKWQVGSACLSVHLYPKNPRCACKTEPVECSHVRTHPPHGLLLMAHARGKRHAKVAATAMVSYVPTFPPRSLWFLKKIKYKIAFLFYINGFKLSRHGSHL